MTSRYIRSTYPAWVYRARRILVPYTSAKHGRYPDKPLRRTSKTTFSRQRGGQRKQTPTQKYECVHTVWSPRDVSKAPNHFRYDGCACALRLNKLRLECRPRGCAVSRCHTPHDMLRSANTKEVRTWLFLRLLIPEKAYNLRRVLRYIGSSFPLKCFLDDGAPSSE